MAIEETVGQSVDGRALSPAQREKLFRAIEEAINEVVGISPSFAFQREQRIRAIATRLGKDFPGSDNWDDDTLGILVRKLGPKGPRGSSIAAKTKENSTLGSN